MATNAVEKQARQVLRTLREDLWTWRPDPLPRAKWLFWLPHGLVILVGILAGAFNLEHYDNAYRLQSGHSLLLALAQAIAVGMACWRPVPAWWLSMASTVAGALAGRAQMFAGNTQGDVPWPWGVAGIVSHCLVLFLLALRVPTRVSMEVLGLTALTTWVLGWTSSGGYSITTTIVLFTVCVLLGTAQRGRRVARTELVEQAGITAEERARRTLLEERSRIARELHDVVAHHMSVISIQAQVAPHLVENPPDELRENLEGIRQNALEALTELRRVLGVLRSEHPDDLTAGGEGDDGERADGFAEDLARHSPQPTLDRLEALVENTRAAGLEVDVEINGDDRAYAPGVELSAYRMIQEALSNALRHAPGSRVRVELHHFPRGLQLRVINSRPERPAPPSPGAGHGLLGMRERATMLGGTIMAAPTSHGGFAVVAFLPRSGTAPVREPVPEDWVEDPRFPVEYLGEPPSFVSDYYFGRAHGRAPTRPTGDPAP